MSLCPDSEDGILGASLEDDGAAYPRVVCRAVPQKRERMSIMGAI